MGELLKNKLKLKEIQNKLKIMQNKYDDFEEELENITSEMDCLEGQIESLEKEEYRLLNQLKNDIKNDIKNNNTPNKFERKITKAALFTDRDGYRKALSYVYIDRNAIYAIDGYRAIEYKHKNEKIDKSMFVDTDNVIDISLFKEVNGDKDKCGLELAKNAIQEHFNKTTGDIFDIDGDYLMNKLLHKENSDGTYDISIFKFNELKIAIKKEFIEEMFLIFENKKFNISYSQNSEPVFFYNNEIKILILPVRVCNIEKL